MRERTVRSFLAALLVVLAAAPAAAVAGTPGHWKPLSGPLPGTGSYPDLLRTADGRLHVAWAQSGATSGLLHRAVTPAGAIGPPSAVVTGYAGVTPPGMLAEGAGLRILFGAKRTVASDEPIQGIVTSASGNGGATWSAPQPTTPCCSQQGTHAGLISAVRLGDGTPLTFSSGSAFSIVAHRGLNPSTPLVSYYDTLQPTFGTVLGAAAARDLKSGVTIVAFQSTAGPRDGVHVIGVNPASGGPQGPPFTLPGLGPGGGGGPFVSSSQPTRIAARAGGGLFVAHADSAASKGRTLLWPLGERRAQVLGRGGGSQDDATVAATPDGRLWVAWTEKKPGKAVRVVVRRSNPKVTRFGAPVTISAPNRTQDIYALDASAQALRLDLVATVGALGGGAIRYSHQHTQVLPPLALSATPRSFRGGGNQRVEFRVTDVGVPVPGATVRAASRSDKTDKQGHTVLKLQGPAAGGRIPVSARKAGYRGDRVVLDVRRADRGKG